MGAAAALRRRRELFGWPHSLLFVFLIYIIWPQQAFELIYLP